MPRGIQQTFDNIQFNLYGHSLAPNFFEAIILKARSVTIIIIITSTGEIIIHIRNMEFLERAMNCKSLAVVVWIKLMNFKKYYLFKIFVFVFSRPFSAYTLVLYFVRHRNTTSTHHIYLSPIQMYLLNLLNCNSVMQVKINWRIYILTILEFHHISRTAARWPLVQTLHYCLATYTQYYAYNNIILCLLYTVRMSLAIHISMYKPL